MGPLKIKFQKQNVYHFLMAKTDKIVHVTHRTSGGKTIGIYNFLVDVLHSSEILLQNTTYNENINRCLSGLRQSGDV